MSLGNLSVKVSADIGAFTTNMEVASRVAQERMAQSAGSVDDFRESLLRTSADLERVARTMGTNMDAANDAIVSGSEKSADAIDGIVKAAESVDAKSMGQKIAEGIGTGIGAGIVAAQTAWDTFVEWTKTKALVTGIAIGAIFAAVGLGAVYTAYKVISGTIGFLTGLLTGSSYKSESIDALIAANDQLGDLQKNLRISAVEAAGLNAALASMGKTPEGYLGAFEAAFKAIHTNTDELDRLGVKYKDAKGNLLPLQEVLQNTSDVLDEYTAGWDRNAAAQSLGFSSYGQIDSALAVTAASIAEAASRLNDYNLGIGDEAQAAVSRYESAMKAFNRELDLTSQGFKRAWADQIMPVLTDLAEFFKDGFPFAVNVFRYTMATITSLFYGLKTSVYIVAESILGSIESIGLGLGGLAMAGVKFLQGDFSGAKDELVKGWSDAKARIGQIGDNIVEQSRRNAAAMRQAWALDDRTFPGEKEEKGKEWVAKPKKDPAATKDPFDTAMNDVARQVVGVKYVIDNFDRLGGKVRESKSAMAEFDITMGKFSDAQRKREEFDPLTPAQKASYIAQNKLLEEGLEKERQLQVLRKFDTSSKQFDFKETQNIENRRLDIEWMGRSKVEIDKLTNARRVDGEVAAMIQATQIELAKEGLTITEKQRGAILARADSAKKAADELIQRASDKSKDPWFNAQDSIRKYGEEAENTGAQIGNAMTNAFKSAEDALTNFVMTGKLGFGDLVKSILAGLVRIQAQKAVASISSGLSSTLLPMLGSLFAGGAGMATTGVDGLSLASNPFAMSAFADGGDPPINRPSIVGERGPELFVPRATGTVVPNELLGGGRGRNVTIYQTNRFEGNKGDAEMAEQLLKLKEVTKAEVFDEMDRR